MLMVLILVVGMVLLVVVLGLPLLLDSDSPVPDYLGFGILAAMIALFIWTMGDWWIMVPILALVALTVRLDRKGRETPADPASLDRRGWSARTRLHLWLWGAALLAIPALFASLFILPQGRAGPVVAPCLMIAIVASTLFKFGFHRSVRRDHGAL